MRKTETGRQVQQAQVNWKLITTCNKLYKPTIEFHLKYT